MGTSLVGVNLNFDPHRRSVVVVQSVQITPAEVRSTGQCKCKGICNRGFALIVVAGDLGELSQRPDVLRGKAAESAQ